MPAPPPPLGASPANLVGAGQFGAMFERSRWWAQRLMRRWWADQQEGAPVRVLRKKNARAGGRRGFRYYTTRAVIDAEFPRRDKALERRLRAMEQDIGAAFSRLAELERRIGARR